MSCFQTTSPLIRFLRFLLLVLGRIGGLTILDPESSQSFNDLGSDDVTTEGVLLEEPEGSQGGAGVSQELRILGRLPVGVEVGQVRGKGVGIGRGGVVIVVVFIGVGGPQQIGIVDGQVGEVVGVGERRDELEFESKARVGEGGGLLGVHRP